MVRARVPDPRRRGERGAVLVFFALLVFGVLGLAGLTVDLGLARAHQERMQGAVESAALEGLAFRDAFAGLPAADQDLLRRDQARLALLSVFDEDGVDPAGLVDGSAPNQQVLLGVGPELSIDPPGGLAGGTVQIDAAALVPDPQLNLDNLLHGDLVAGDLDPLMDAATCAALLGLPPGYAEAADYTRCDFDGPELPPDATSLLAQPSFLARLRRTPDAGGFDRQPGVSSGLSPLPWLLGRGSLASPLPGGGLDQGLALRATAIAHARPAVAATAAGAGGPGLLRLTLDAGGSAWLGVAAERWATCLPAETPVDVLLGAAGALELVSACGGSTALGRTLPADLGQVGLSLVGEPAPAAGAASLLPTTGLAVLPLYADVAGVPRVVGYGAVSVEPPLGAGQASLVRRAGPGGEGLILPRGASAVFVPARHPVLPPAEQSQLLAAGPLLTAPLLAPILAR